MHTREVVVCEWTVPRTLLNADRAMRGCTSRCRCRWVGVLQCKYEDEDRPVARHVWE